MKMNIQEANLITEAENLTNQDGKNFLHTWVKGRHTLTEISQVSGNWFLALASDNVSYFLPYDRDSARGCKAGVFGNGAHYEKHKLS